MYYFTAGATNVGYGARDAYGDNDAEGYSNNGLWASFINVIPRIVRSGNEVDFFIAANYLDAATSVSDFNKQGDYVRFLSK